MNERKKVSNKSEKQLAKKYNGKIKAGSGCSWQSKGDVKTEKFLFDDKTFIEERKSFSLNKISLWKHFEDALKERKIGVFRIGFDNIHKVIVMEENDFFEMFQKLEG